MYVLLQQKNSMYGDITDIEIFGCSSDQQTVANWNTSSTMYNRRWIQRVDEIHFNAETGNYDKIRFNLML